MANPPQLHLQPVSVDFIDNRMPQQHIAFRDTQARYDMTLRRYVPASTTAESLGKAPLASQDPTPSTPTPIEAMRFWNSIFDEALHGLCKSNSEESSIISERGYSLRCQRDWNGVYTQLQKAREHYDGTKQGFRGRCKRGLRQMATRSDLASGVIRLVPDIDYISPVMAVVEVVLEAAHAASEVREKVTSNLEVKNLEQLFGDIELFLATFPDDQKVKTACVDLVIAVFVAIEEAIEFFLKSQARRVASAFFHGGKYQSQLIQRITLIHDKSESLIRQAQNSHISKVREDMKRILTASWRIEIITEEIRDDIKDGVESLEQSIGTSAGIIISSISDLGVRTRNYLMKVLDEVKRHREEDLAMHETRWRVQEERTLLAEKAILRYMTPSPTFQPPVPWLPQYPIPPSTPQTQIAWLPQQPQYSPDKLVAPLIQPYQVPLPQRFTYHWPPGPHGPTNAPQTPLSQLLTHLNLTNPNFDISDLNTILNHEPLIPLRQRVRAEQAFNTDEFSSWLTSRGPSQLLIHGDFDRSHPPLISGLSFASATLVDTIREHQKGFISLAYFCGQHAERDDEYAGGMKMVASLIFQLLRQCPQLDVAMAGDMQLIQTGELGCLCNLLARIVRGIPKQTTVVFVIDGAVHYENRYFERELVEVVKFVLDLGKHQDNGYSWSSTVKVLVSSPIKTEKVWREFEDGHGILEMEGLPVVGDSYSQGLEFGLGDVEGVV